MLKFIIITFLFLRCSSDPRSNRQKRIVGGYEVHNIQHPYQISLRSKIDESEFFTHYCGGTILSPRVIITAGHCIYKKKLSKIMVVAGSDYRHASNGAISPVEKFVIHEKFDYDHLKYDIGLLFLGAELPVNNFTIKSIELADKRPPIGAMATISGWGKTSEDAYNYPDKLREVRIPIISNKECRKMYPEIGINDAMLCAGIGEGGKDGCQGDSGGGFVYNGKLIGITSYGKGCARKQSPGVFTSIADMKQWIEQHVKQF